MFVLRLVRIIMITETIELLVNNWCLIGILGTIEQFAHKCLFLNRNYSNAYNYYHYLGNFIIVYKLLVLNRNTLNQIIVCKQMIIIDK